jgi:putative phage holliday junction resolvase
MTKIVKEFELQRKTGKNSSLAKGNEMISANDRLNPIVKSKITKHLRELAYQMSEPLAEPFSPDKPCKVDVIVFAPTRRRMDAPNWYPTVKALIDGMTDADILTDDNNHIIKKMSFAYGGLSGTKKYKLKIIITELEKK